MLLKEFLKPMKGSQSDLAKKIHVPYQRINELVNGKRGITPATALRLAKFFGMSAGGATGISSRDGVRTVRSQIL